MEQTLASTSQPLGSEDSGEIYIEKTDDSTELYVNVFCFSVTILCYVALLLVLGYTLWKLLESAIRRMERLCSREEDDSSVPYRVIKSRQNAPHVTVIPIITNEDLLAAKANNSDCKNPPPNPDDMKSV